MLNGKVFTKMNWEFRILIRLQLKNIKVNYTLLKNIKKADKIGAVNFISNRKVNTIML